MTAKYGMRNWITLCENLVRIDDQMLASVQEYLADHLSDWSEDHEDDEVLRSALSALVAQITDAAYHDGKLLCVRAELRPQEELDASPLNSVGGYWSWGGEGGVCNHDSASDWHGVDHAELAEIVLCANIGLGQIDWVQTLAKNLVLKNEAEITVKDGEEIQITDVMSCKPHQPRIQFTNYKTVVYNIGEF